ncbi:hypothetical protein FDA94_09430 [Herbidospora galbida]|uniref:Uncharacterized protein n=1 Tax=Herbidospora galbida TaxID=2575442 RepID=A0A4U3MJA5_9ACTN|nr:hypothetical protein [Herbidospora galbida]TKK89598.1 hypothetical protein FDA94_09430 [Herbidospora galbida]
MLKRKKKQKKPSTTTTTTPASQTGNRVPSPGFSLAGIFGLSRTPARQQPSRQNPSNTTTTTTVSSTRTPWTRSTPTQRPQRSDITIHNRRSGEGSSSSSSEPEKVVIPDDVPESNESGESSADQGIPSGVLLAIEEMDEVLQLPGADEAVYLPVGSLGLTLKIDYGPLRRMEDGEEADFINARMAQIMGGPYPIGVPFMRKYGTSDPRMTVWVMRALCLLSDNAEELSAMGVDPKKAVERLIAMAKKQSRMSISAPSHGFEMQILQVGGFVESKLLADLLPPNQPTVLKLLSLYHPARTERGEILILPPLKTRQLDLQLKKLMHQVVVGEYKAWRETGKPLAHHSIGEIAKVAGFLQGWLKERFGTFPLAAVDSIYHNGWTYEKQIVSTLSKPGDDNELLGWLMNRGQLVGWGKNYGAPFTAASYDPSRPQDREALQKIYDDLLGDPQFRKALTAVSKLTACCAKGQGKIMVQPLYPSTKVVTRVQFHWRQARTLIHEFLHALTHQNLTEASRGIGEAQVLTEGLTDLLTAHFFAQLVEEVRSNGEIRQLILGGEPFEEPAAKHLEVGYGAAGEKAKIIKALVGMDNLMAAYFLGAVKFIGL